MWDIRKSSLLGRVVGLAVVLLILAEVVVGGRVSLNSTTIIKNLK